eukprot:PITA_07356
MGYLYEAMDKAKEAIRAYYEDKGDKGLEKQQVIWRVIDERWNNTLYHPIHVADIYVNPAFSYSCSFRFDAKVMDRFLTCDQSMVASEKEREDISKEMKIYRMASGTFGFTMTIKNKTTKMPNAWCTSYGGRVPHLQNLSQTCNSSRCEHNWSVFDKIKNKKRNRLESQHLNDMVYVYCNLRLWMRQLQKTLDVESISLVNIDTIAAWRVETERPTMDSIADWLDVDPKELVAEKVAIAREGEPEVEEEEQGEEVEQEEVTPSRMGNSGG